MELISLTLERLVRSLHHFLTALILVDEDVHRSTNLTATEKQEKET